MTTSTANDRSSGYEPTGRVLITGASGGLGRELVPAFLAAGWLVVAGYHRENQHAPTSEVLPVAMDVTSEEAVTEVVRRVEQAQGPIDVLVNNAGVADDALAGAMSEDRWRQVMDVNLTGAFRCSREVLPGMIERRRGHILNVASYAGIHGSAGQANYASAKAGLIGLTRALAKEVGTHGICVNAVLPGFLRTPMTAALSSRVQERYLSAHVLGRFADLAEVARTIAFLAGLTTVSGQVFQLDSRIG